MKTNDLISNRRGLAPIFIIVIVLLVLGGGVTYSVFDNEKRNSGNTITTSSDPQSSSIKIYHLGEEFTVSGYTHPSEGGKRIEDALKIKITDYKYVRGYTTKAGSSFPRDFLILIMEVENLKNQRIAENIMYPLDEEGNNLYQGTFSSEPIRSIGVTPIKDKGYNSLLLYYLPKTRIDGGKEFPIKTGAEVKKIGIIDYPYSSIEVILP